MRITSMRTIDVRIGARHWCGKPPGIGHDRGGDRSGLRRGFYPVLRHRAIRRYRRLPCQAWPAYHPDEVRSRSRMVQSKKEVCNLNMGLDQAALT